MTGDVWEFACLIAKDSVVGVECCNHDVVLFWYGTNDIVVIGGRSFGGSYPLALSLHVSLLCFLGFWEMFVNIFDIDEGPCVVVSTADGLEPC